MYSWILFEGTWFTSFLDPFLLYRYYNCIFWSFLKTSLMKKRLFKISFSIQFHNITWNIAGTNNAYNHNKLLLIDIDTTTMFTQFSLMSSMLQIMEENIWWNGWCCCWKELEKNLYSLEQISLVNSKQVETSFSYAIPCLFKYKSIINTNRNEILFCYISDFT